MARRLRSPGAMSIQVSDRDAVLKGRKIVVIDDHTDSVELFELALELCGADARGFRNAADAAVAIRTDPPDAVVSDLEIGDGDGLIQLLSMLKRLDIPALVLTGHARQEDLARALAAGFDDYRVKPIDPMELCRAVEKMLERRAGLA
jgi:DNA-binding NtrC family response regulator